MTLREQLAAQKLPRDWVVANFVSNQSGEVEKAGSSRPLSNEIDKASLLAYRDRANLVLTTAATARSEEYRRLNSKTLAIVSRSGNFDGIPAIESGSTPLFLIVPSAARPIAKKYLAHENTYLIALRKFSPRKIRRALKIRGYRRIVLEGGITFTNWFIAGRALSELALSLTGLKSTFTQSDALGFLAKLPAGNFKLISKTQIDDTALTTWAVSSKTSR